MSERRPARRVGALHAATIKTTATTPTEQSDLATASGSGVLKGLIITTALRKHNLRRVTSSWQWALRDDTWRRAAPDEASSWRESRREDADREERRDRGERRERVERRDRDRRDDREPRAPTRSQEEGKLTVPANRGTFNAQMTTSPTALVPKG